MSRPWNLWSLPGAGSAGRTCPEVSAVCGSMANCFSPPVTPASRPEAPRRARLDAPDVGADLREILIPAARLQARVAELAAEIDADYAGHDLLLVGVLKGAGMVMAELARGVPSP